VSNTARRFEGQVALVTGASRGIGRAIAVRLAGEGAQVIINHFRGADEKFQGAAEEAQRLARQAGGDAILYEANMSDTAAVRQMIRDVAARFGRLDVLVNNAGICPMVEFLDITEQIWDQVHNLNLRAVFFATQEASRVMIENKTRGRIVCISSISGEFGTPTQIHYAPTKAGINMIVRSVASVVGPYGITINAIAPGDIETDISREWDEANPEEIQRYIERCPVRRRGRAEDIAAAVAFVASPEAEFINGSVYFVDGGITSVL
jgi:NAD(P)-dependent dehydrogenase (short-subunit alcohol dehydrogenase family)